MFNNDSLKIRIPSAIIVVSVFFLSYFIYGDFSIKLSYGYIVLALLSVTIIYQSAGIIRLSKIKICALLYIMAIDIFFIISGSYIDKGNFSIIISLNIGGMYILISDCRIEDISLFLKMAQGSSFVVSLYIIFVKLYPQLYWNITRNVISQNSVRIVDILLRGGYGVVIGGNVVLAIYICLLGMIVSLNRLFLSSLDRRSRYYCIVTAALTITAVLFSNRKSELLVTLIILIMMIINKYNYNSMTKRRKAFAVLFLALPIIMYIVISLSSTSFFNRYFDFLNRLSMNRSNNVELDVSSGRITLWKTAWSLFIEKPAFGIGWGNFAGNITYTYNELNDGALRNVHNNYLQLLCETGVVGFLIILTPLLILFVFTIFGLKDVSKKKNEMSQLVIAISTSFYLQVFSLGISFIDPIWYKRIYGLLFAIIVILADSAYLTKRDIDNYYVDKL